MLAGHSVHLLVVEDDPHAVAMIREMLDSRRAQFAVESTESLAGGLARLKAETWDAVLLDLSLTDSDGIETFRAVRSAAPETSIIILTGHSDEEMAMAAVQEGAQDYLLKGRVEGGLLSRSILYAIERTRAQGELRAARAALESRVGQRTRELREANERLQAEVAERLATAERLRLSNVRLEQALAGLRESQNQLIQRERLHALGNMASGIAHDFNNSLSPIVGLTDLLLQSEEKLADKELVRRYLGMISTSAKSAGRVVQSLREFHREQREGEDFRPIDLNDLILRVVEITKPKWHDLAMARGVGIQIHTDLEATPPVLGQGDQLGQVLASLVFNSVEALEKQGAIQIRTRLRGGHVVLEVEDDGAGMEKEVLRQCMDPFFTTKGKKSSGFGLPTVFGIVERHNGTIVIESQPGEGTLVRIRIPVAEGPDRQADTGAASAGDDAGGAPMRGLRVLAGDDEPLVRELILACLKTDGHQVTMTSDGAGLAEAFEAGKFDVVITDRAMPGLSGDQVARIVKEREPSVKVILLTGFGDLMAATNEHPEGVDLIISKPFTIDDIRGALRTAMSAGAHA